MNIELLNRVKAHILAEPKRIDMLAWITPRSPEVGGPQCGTVGCIAGWAVILSIPKEEWIKITDFEVAGIACTVLEIDSEQADQLFYFAPYSEWGTPEYATDVAVHIEDFIKQNA